MRVFVPVFFFYVQGRYRPSAFGDVAAWPPVELFWHHTCYRQFNFRVIKGVIAFCWLISECDLFFFICVNLATQREIIFRIMLSRQRCVASSLIIGRAGCREVVCVYVCSGVEILVAGLALFSCDFANFIWWAIRRTAPSVTWKLGRAWNQVCDVTAEIGDLRTDDWTRTSYRANGVAVAASQKNFIS